MSNGGIVMYPLLLCCFATWIGIFFHLPLWQNNIRHEERLIRQGFMPHATHKSRHRFTIYQQLLQESRARTMDGLSTIKVLTGVAPILGLLGTVTGMINTFEAVAIYGLNNPKALASGISEAMITTQFGLLIALPGILAVFILQRKAKRKQEKIALLTADLMEGQLNA